MQLRQQRAGARDVRARHRGAADDLEQAAGLHNAAGGVWSAAAARMSTPGAVTSGLARSGTGVCGPRDENAASTAGAVAAAVPAVIEPFASLPASAIAAFTSKPSAWVRATVGIQYGYGAEVLRVHGVVEDHADAAGVRDDLALLDPVVDAAEAQHDLPDHLGRVERARLAELGVLGRGGRQRGVLGVDEGRRRSASIDEPPVRARSSPGASVIVAVALKARELVAAATAVSHGTERRRADGLGARAGVAGGVGHEDAGVGRAQEGDLVGSDARRSVCRRWSS